MLKNIKTIVSEKAIQIEKARREKLMVRMMRPQRGHQWLVDGFILMPNKILIDKVLKTGDKIVFAGLVMHLFSKQKCFPSISTLARELHFSRPSVISALKHLEKAGFLKIEKDSGQVNVYSPIFSPVNVDDGIEKIIDKAGVL